MINKIALIIISGLIFFSGCGKLGKVSIFSLFDKKEEKVAEELIADGMEEFKNENYSDAIDAFQKLKDQYPFSKYTILAALKEADSYYKLGKYEDAAFGYEEFENLHPKNEAIPYVIYQQGLCHFKKIDTPDRDQSSAYKAMETFQRLIDTHPDTTYAKEAKDLTAQCIKNITEHELYVGIFYFKAKHYKAALNRFKNIIEKYPDTGTHNKAIQYITECEKKIINSKE